MMIVGIASGLYHDLNMQNLIYDKYFKVSKQKIALNIGLGRIGSSNML